MKIYKHLSEKILTIENFRTAYKNATKGKRHYEEVREIDKDPETYLQNLLEEVQSGRYRVSEYTIFQLYTGLKWREIYKLPMKDRIVQHAIMNYCEPIFRESFIMDTYSSIKTRGIHLGLKRVKAALRDTEYLYCLKLDIHKCYPSLDKEILKQKLNRKFNAKTLQWLFEIIIDSCEKGVPIGNYTSQYFNNFYFSDFDHWIKEVKRVKHYFRYCDDIVILGRTKEELHELLKEIKAQLAELHVELKGNYQVFSIADRGIDFLGYITRRSHIAIRKHIKLNFIDKITSMDFNDITDKDLNILGSYWGILSHADCRHLWQKYTGTHSFAEFKKTYHPECSAAKILKKAITIYEAKVAFNKKVTKLHIRARLDGKLIVIHTTSKLLIQAVIQRGVSKEPWNTTIVKSQRGYYIFTQT